MIIPCAKCGTPTEGKRITKTCDDCRRERRQAYYAENKDAVKAQVTAWKVANPDKFKAQRKRHSKRKRLARLQEILNAV